MRLALIEYLSAGGRIGVEPPTEAMQAQGIAMLLAAARDLCQFFSLVIPLADTCAAIPTIDLDANLPMIDGDAPLETIESQWLEQALDCDAALIIAPETNDILERLLARFTSAGVPVLNSDTQFVACASDKRRTAVFFEAAGIPTPPTMASDEAPPAERRGMWLQKPRFGCGSEGIVPLAGEQPLPGNIGQEFIPGAPVGCAVVAMPDGSCTPLTPLIQKLRRGSFEYQGSDGPITDKRVESQVRELACRAVQALPGNPLGYVGVDLVVPADGDPIVLEINPRYTVSVQYLPLPDRHRLATAYEAAARKLVQESAE